MLERRSSSQQQQRQKLKQRRHGVVVDSKPWISESEQQKARGQSSSLSSFSPPRPPPSVTEEPSNAAGNCGNMDRVLFNNLVEMVPLVESLMDRRGNSSFTRRASMIYTPAPTRKKKNVEPKSHEAPQTASTKKNRVIGDNTSDKQTAADNQDIGADGFSIFSKRSSVAEKEREDNMLREQVDELQKKLLAKDESLKSAEDSLQSAQVALDDLKRQLLEKDSLVKSAQLELNNTKIKLADKQAASEKLEWENREANSKAEKLQQNLASADFEIGAFMQFFEELSKNHSVATLDESIICFDNFDYLPSIDIDEAAIEQARLAYEAALAFAKDNPGEETLARASEARTKLHCFVV